MARSGYEWSLEARRWREKASGRFASEGTITGWRNTFRRALENEATSLTDRLARGEIDVRFWEKGMQKITRDAHQAEFMLSKGGRNNLTAADRKVIGKALDEQFDYLRGLTRQVGAGELTERAAAARARMYARSGTSSYARGQEAAWGISLPGYPGQGVQCLSNCRCAWRITTRRKVIVASYIVAPGDTCKDCLSRGSQWASLEFPKPEA